jgi:[acyl-carrier-protein] S-malonyltransferase
VRKTVKLAVSVPSHTPLMREAADRLGDAIAAIDWQMPDRPWCRTPTRRPRTPWSASPTRWCASCTCRCAGPNACRALAAGGAARIVECGPGKVLAGLAKRIDKSLEGRAIGAPADFDAALADSAPEPVN